MDGQPQPAAPRGLLGLFGPREDDPRSPAERRRDILSNLAIGLSGLSMFPNTAMINALQGGIEERRETRKEALAAEKALQSKSRTVEWLRSQGREELAAAVEAGALDGKSAELQGARRALERLARQCHASEEGPCPIITAFDREGLAAAGDAGQPLG